MPRNKTLCKIGKIFIMVLILLAGLAHFIWPLDWAKGCQIAGKILFLSVSVRVFPEKFAFESID